MEKPVQNPMDQVTHIHVESLSEEKRSRHTSNSKEGATFTDSMDAHRGSEVSGCRETEQEERVAREAQSMGGPTNQAPIKASQPNVNGMAKPIPITTPKPGLAQCMMVKRNRNMSSYANSSSKSIMSVISDKRNVDIVFVIDRCLVTNFGNFLEAVDSTLANLQLHATSLNMLFSVFVVNSAQSNGLEFTSNINNVREFIRNFEHENWPQNENQQSHSPLDDLASLTFRSKSTRIAIHFMEDPSCIAADDVLENSVQLGRVYVHYICAYISPNKQRIHNLLSGQFSLGQFSLVNVQDVMTCYITSECEKLTPTKISERMYMMYNPTYSHSPLEDCRDGVNEFEACLQYCVPLTAFDSELIPNLESQNGQIKCFEYLRDYQENRIYKAVFESAGENRTLLLHIPRFGLVDETKQDSHALIQWMKEKAYARNVANLVTASTNKKLPSKRRIEVIPAYILRVTLSHGKRCSIFCEDFYDFDPKQLTLNAIATANWDVSSHLLAVSHFSNLVTRSKIVLSDFCGTFDNNTIRISDLGLIYDDVCRFGPYNLGLEGMKLFLRGHNCTTFCVDLGLRRQVENTIQETNQCCTYAYFQSCGPLNLLPVGVGIDDTTLEHKMDDTSDMDVENLDLLAEDSLKQSDNLGLNAISITENTNMTTRVGFQDTEAHTSNEDNRDRGNHERPSGCWKSIVRLFRRLFS